MALRVLTELNRLFDAGEQARPFGVDLVEGSRFDKSLRGLLVDEPQVHSSAKVEDVLEPAPFLPHLHDVLHRLYPHVLDRAQSEPHPPRGADTLDGALVDIGG